MATLLAAWLRSASSAPARHGPTCWSLRAWPAWLSVVRPPFCARHDLSWIEPDGLRVKFGGEWSMWSQSAQTRSLVHAKSQERAENSHESAQTASKTPHTTTSQLPTMPITHRSPVLIKPDLHDLGIATRQAGQYKAADGTFGGTSQRLPRRAEDASCGIWFRGKLERRADFTCPPLCADGGAQAAIQPEAGVSAVRARADITSHVAGAESAAPT